MNRKRIIIFIVLGLLLYIYISLCYPGISGVVVDAETGKPIQGAVVLAQWNKSHGIGDIGHTVYKIIETETDANGRFSLSGVYNPTVDPPRLVVYRKGFVAWRNDEIFPSNKKRTDYTIWQRNYVYRLEEFKEGYSRNLHDGFLNSGIIGTSLKKTPKFFAIKSQVLNDALRELREQEKALGRGASHDQQ